MKEHKITFMVPDELLDELIEEIGETPGTTAYLNLYDALWAAKKERDG